MIPKEKKYSMLVKQHKNMIYGYALYMLKDRMEADDVAQEVLIRLWNNMDSINLLAAKPWLMRTTHNLCIDYIRKRKPVYQIDEEFSEAVEANENESNPLIMTQIKMAANKIKELIKELPEHLRSVFVLYELEGLKYKEISKTLDLPINTVKVQLLRARRRLQEKLKNYE
jgi:RNA polymerase sigma-70 factor (ECF subfamily)